MDRPAHHRGGEARRRRRLRHDDPHAARCRLQYRQARSQRWGAGSSRHPGRGRAPHPRALLHVRREAGRSRGVVLAAVGGAARRQARFRQGDRWPGRGESKGSGSHLPRRAARSSRRRPQGPGESGAGGRGRGGDRLAALQADRPGPRGESRALQMQRHLHAVRGAGSEWPRHHQPRSEGRGRTGAGLQRREVGPRAEPRHPLQPQGERGQPRLAPGASAAHPRLAGRQHPRD